MITWSSPALSVWPGLCRSRTLVLPLSFSDACVNNQSVIYCTDNHITFETHSWNDHLVIFCSLCLARDMSLSHPRSSSIFLWCLREQPVCNIPALTTILPLKLIVEMITWSSPALSVWPGLCRSRTLVLPLSFSDACVNNQSVIYCTDNHITFETHSWNDHLVISCSLCLAWDMSLSHPRSSSIFLWCLREQPVCNILHWQPYYLWNS